MATKKLTQYALFLAIILLLGLSPLGYIQLPMVAITLVHVPVILGSFFFSIPGSMVLGLFFGTTSLITAFTRPTAISAVILGANTGFSLYNLFLIIIVIFVPRILVGLISAVSFRTIVKKSEIIAMGTAAILGTLTNTVFFLGALYLFAFEKIGLAMNLGAGFTGGDLIKVFLGIVSLNGVFEAIAAVIISVGIGRAVSVYLKRRGQRA